MNVNQKGVRGLIKVIDDLSMRGWYVFPAFDDHSPVDLIALSPEGKVARLQIKYREPMNRTKAVRYELTAHTTIGGKLTPIDRRLIDGWAVYMADRDRVTYIPVSAMDGIKYLNVNPDVNYGELDEWFMSAPC